MRLITTTLPDNFPFTPGSLEETDKSGEWRTYTNTQTHIHGQLHCYTACTNVVV